MTRETFILQYVIHNAAALLSTVMTTTADIFDLAEKAAIEAEKRDLFNKVEAKGDARTCSKAERDQLVANICATIPAIIAANPGIGYNTLHTTIINQNECTQSVAKDAIILAYNQGLIRKEDPSIKTSPIILA